MNSPHDQKDAARQSFWASLFLLCFGLGTLTFLTAVEPRVTAHLASFERSAQAR